MKYKEWEHDTLEKMHMQILKKVGCIMKDSDDGKNLTSNDMDNLWHAVTIIEKIHHIMEDHLHEEK